MLFRSLALVNPTDTARTYDLPESDLAYLLVTPFGGGRIAADGQIERASGLIYTRQTGAVALADWSGLVLVTTLPGDANLDWQVDVMDLALLGNAYGSSGATWTEADFNGDGQVDVFDLGLLGNYYGRAVTGAGEPVPAPAAAVLLAVGAAALPRKRQRPG